METIVIFFFIFILIYVWLRNLHKHCQNRVILCEKPTFFFGNLTSVFLSKECLNDNANKFRGETFFGFYSLWKPCLVIRDPKIVKDILIRDFKTHFYDRPWANDKHVDRLVYYILLNLKNPIRKKVRSQNTPLFTLAKLKLISLMLKYTEKLIKHLKQNKNETIDFKVITKKYSLEVITSCAFGIEANGFTNENSEIVRTANYLCNFDNTSRPLQMFSYFYMPFLVYMLRLKLIEPKSLKIYSGKMLSFVKKQESREMI